MRTPWPARLAAALSLGCAAVFVVLMVGVLRMPGAVGIHGYISQLGERGAGTAPAYRNALLAAAAAVALLGLALRRRPALLGTAGLLVAAGLLLAAGAVVPCDRGCPVPLRQGWTSAANLVHFGASGAVFVLTTSAMALLAGAAGAPVVRTISLWACRFCAVCFVLLCLLMLLFAQGLANSVVERLLAAATVLWVVAVAAAVGVGLQQGDGVRHDHAVQRTP